MHSQISPHRAQRVDFQGRYGTSWNYLMAGTITATVPSILVFLVFQRALVRGIATSGLKD